MGMVSRPEAALWASRLAACFPRPAVGRDTLVEWAEEFVGLDPVTAEAVLERLKARADRAPTIRQIRSAIVAERNATERAMAHAKAITWGTSAPVDQPTTFAAWAATDPARARKLVGALDGKSYVRARIEDVIAKGSEIFDALATDGEPTVDDRYTWSRYDPPCDLCRRPVENGTNSQASYNRDTDTWTNAHIVCPPLPDSSSSSEKGVR